MRTLGIIAISLLLFGVAGFKSVFAQTSVISATVRPNPLEVSVSAPSSVVVGQWFNISADVSNLSDDLITQTIVILNSPPEIKIKAARKKINNLAAHQTTTVSWQAKANAAGDFIITAEASGKLLGEPISSSDSTSIAATGSLGAFLLRRIFGV